MHGSQLDTYVCNSVDGATAVAEVVLLEIDMYVRTYSIRSKKVNVRSPVAIVVVRPYP